MVVVKSLGSDEVAQPTATGAASVPSPIVYVSFSAEIKAETTEALINVLSNCANQKVREVYLLISTPGGNVMNGMNLYNVMRAMPFELTTHNVGNVDSIGNAIFLAGKRRFACEHSTFMFHGVGFDAVPGTRLEEKMLSETLANVRIEHARIGAVITERTKLSNEQVSAFFREAQTKDAKFAQSVGIIDAIKDVSIPAGVPIVPLVFKR